MADIIQRIALIAAIPAIFGFLLWRYQLAELAKYGGKSARKVIIADPNKADYFWVGNRANRRIPTDVENAVYKRDGEYCQICGIGGFRGNANSFGEHLQGLKGDKPLNVDHKYIPASYNGPAILENLQIACQECNIKKRNKLDNESFKWLSRRGETICLRKNKL